MPRDEFYTCLLLTAYHVACEFLLAGFRLFVLAKCSQCVINIKIPAATQKTLSTTPFYRKKRQTAFAPTPTHIGNAPTDLISRRLQM